MKLSNMANVLRAAGLKVVETPGWANRGFAPEGQPLDLAATRGVLWHHTATDRDAFKTSVAPTLNLCINGRSDLPGPLCHIVLGRNGVVYLVAAGLANHAGWGRAPGIPDDTGNYYFIGIEMESSGVVPWDWTLDQLRVAPLLGAALEKAYLSWLPESDRLQMGHMEYSTAGKIDPAGWPGGMDGLRASINKALNSQEDDMAVSAAEMKAIAAAVWDYPIQQYNTDGTKGSIQKAGFLEGNAGQWIQQLRGRLDKSLAVQAAQTEIIKQLAAGGNLNVDELVAKMGEVVEKTMADVVKVQVSVEGADA